MERVAILTAVWGFIAALAVINGVFREKVLLKAFGERKALALSGLTLSMLIFITSYIFVPFFGCAKELCYLFAGLYWLSLTLSFEFLFGHYVAGRPWREIAEVFNIAKGDLFTLVLLFTLCSPWLAAKMRDLL